MSMEVTSQSGDGVLEEFWSSPGLLLALLGQDAMRRLREAHTASDLSPRQFHLLGLLHDRGPTAQRELGHALAVDPSILVTLLNPLERDGFISRQRDPDDRRRHVVTLTPAGESHLNAAAQAQREAEDEVLASLDDDERDQLRGLLIVLRDGLAADRDHSQCAPDPGGTPID
jgi:DNA-binding MarR family transcriptional regulator